MIGDDVVVVRPDNDLAARESVRDKPRKVLPHGAIAALPCPRVVGCPGKAPRFLGPKGVVRRASRRACFPRAREAGEHPHELLALHRRRLVIPFERQESVQRREERGGILAGSVWVGKGGDQATSQLAWQL